MKITRYIGYFSLILTLFIFSIFFINLFEEKEINFPERNLPLGEIKTFDGNLLDVSLLKKNEFSLLNVWATWCINCKLEHGFLMAKKVEGWNIVGLNYKDDSVKARDWLVQLGNPYRLNIVDEDGALGLDLGVYGAPETYVIDEAGRIVHRHVGVLDASVFARDFQSWFPTDRVPDGVSLVADQG